MLSIFSMIYIICSLISIYYGSERAVQTIISGNYREAYVDNSSGEVAFYTNQFERLAKILTQYFLPVAMLTLFYYLTLQKVKSFRIIILALAVILPTIVSSINIGNRSMIIQFLILLLICYFVFHTGISKKRKQIIVIPSVIFFVLVFILMSAVTISRFGEEQGNSSVFYYLGHSMLTFNYGMTDTIDTYTYGKYFFSWFVDIFGGNSIIDTYKLGGHFEGAFTTFVGALYMDFGPIGTFIIALIVPEFMSLFFRRKKQIDIANIYMFTFSLNYYTYGVLVVGYASGLTWMMAFIVFGILKKFK